MDKRHIISLLTCFILVATAQSAAAQNAETQNAVDSVAVIDAKVEALDTKVTTLQKIADKLPGISGFIQFLYTWENTEPTTSQFRVRRARIILAGNIYKKYADYNLTVEFAGNVKPIDAYIRLTPWKEFNVQIGAFRPAFTLENMFYGATSMELIEYPQIVSRMTTIGDISGAGNGSAGRDLGIQAYGGFFNKRGFSTLQYYVGVVNGNGLEFSGINSHKDIAAMLRVNPVEHLAVIGSLYCGKWAPDGAGSYADRNRWSGGFIYDDRKWFARGEYIGGVTGGMESKNLLVKPENGRLTSDGAYLMGGVWFCNHRIAPIVRAEYYSQNTGFRKETTDIFYTAGLLYTPWKYLRLQMNYTAKTYTYQDKTGHQVSVMLTGMF